MSKDDDFTTCRQCGWPWALCSCHDVTEYEPSAPTIPPVLVSSPQWELVPYKFDLSALNEWIRASRVNVGLALKEIEKKSSTGIDTPVCCHAVVRYPPGRYQYAAR